MDPRRIFGHVFSVEVAIAAAVFVLVCLTLIVALLLSWRRRRKGLPPSSREERTKIELIYAAAVAVVAGFVVALSFHTTGQEAAKADEPAANIKITGFQWCWRFSYPGSARTVTGTCQGGQLPTMVVPVGRPVTLQITSSDVIHSWWVPHLRYKLDAFPNHTNTVTIKIDKAGRWVGRCAEFCGAEHTYMDFYLKAVPENQYRQWLAGSAA
jgi:cytochrome c oxidase subunit 2